jgi:hypothetical protein
LPYERNVVEEFMLEETKIRICDDYCKEKTPEQVQEILDRIAQIMMNCHTKETN